jgi:hypothetical protein
MQIEIPHGRGPGHWQRILVDELGDHPKWAAIVWCPECGRGLFARNHTIDGNGQITPSLGHPTEYPPCGWHTSPKLLDWAPVPPTPGPREFNTCAGCGFKDRSLGGWGTWGDVVGLICPQCVEKRRSASTRVAGK